MNIAVAGMGYVSLSVALLPSQRNEVVALDVVQGKVDDDPRITSISRVLRKTSLDELSQFLNVLAGQISVVGPHPIVADELAALSMADAAEMLSVHPGVTGWWQVTDRNEAIWENGHRLPPELHYVRNASLHLDTEAITRTFGVMFGRRKTRR